MSQAEKKNFPPQDQHQQPGREAQMRPRPRIVSPGYRGAEKLKDKVAFITGGDSGIGRAVAVLYAREGADVAILYKDETEDAEQTKRLVEAEGRRCLVISGDVGDESVCREAVERTVKELGKLDVVVNNAAEQHEQTSLEDISAEQLERTFRTNLFGYFFVAKAAMKHLKKGAAIINTTSVTAYRGSPKLMDYAATKGAILAFTRSLAMALAEKGIRVNGVAPGPIWTPLIPASFKKEEVETFGTNVPLGRAGQPEEVAPAYVFLASEDGSYMTGQVLHPNGGEIVNA